MVDCKFRLMRRYQRTHKPKGNLGWRFVRSPCAIRRGGKKGAERRLPSQNGAGATLKSPRSHIAFSFCMTGSEGVDTDLARHQFERQSSGQRFDGAFCGRVAQGSRHGMRADDGAEVDDASALRAEPLDRLLRRENHSQNVDVGVDMKAPGIMRWGAGLRRFSTLRRISVGAGCA